MIRGNLSDIIEWLRAHDDFIVVGHVSPDGDCCGSCIAMALALRMMGKRAFASFPGGVPKRFRTYLREGIAFADTDTVPFEPKSVFAIDVSDAPRMGTINGERFKNCETVANLDHHATNDGLGDPFYVDSEAAAAAEIITELLQQMEIPFDKEIATWLYIGIVTDCGQFGFSNTTARTMRAAASLMETGIDVSDIIRHQYHTATEGKKRLTGRTLSDFRLVEGGRIVVSKLTDEILAQCGATREDSEALVSNLLEIEGVEISVMADEREPGKTKVSLRSKMYVDVATDIAKVFGGGGHARAAGCTIEGSPEEAIEKILCVAKQALHVEGNA